MQLANNLASKFKGYLLATHFGPTLLVVTIAFLLSLTQISLLGSIQIAIAILAGQCVIGWSNDLIDFPLDLQANREKKPLVVGAVKTVDLERAIFIALFFALALSLISPLGLKGTLVHALGLLSATFYNLKLKRTKLSIFPYIISFGAMPWAIYLSIGKRPSIWLTLGFVLFASAFHFLNVLKDLKMDISQGILGLPQLMGRQRSLTAATALIICGVVLIVLKWRLLLGIEAA